MKHLTEQQKEEQGITTFDVAEYLDNDELIALYLAETLKDGTEAEFIQALNDVARAKGMNEIRHTKRKPLSDAFKQ